VGLVQWIHTQTHHLEHAQGVGNADQRQSQPLSHLGGHHHAVGVMADDAVGAEERRHRDAGLGHLRRQRVDLFLAHELGAACAHAD
jgi:hypothetical protein